MMHNVNGIDYHRANPENNASVRATVIHMDDGTAAVMMTLQTEIGNFLVPLGADTAQLLVADLACALAGVEP